MTPAKMVMAALMMPVLILLAVLAVVALFVERAKRRTRVRSAG